MAANINKHPAVAVFGGTYNPVHYGHLRSALELCVELGLDQLRFMPCHRPVHRDEPECSAEQRLAMLELAIEGQPLFAVDKRELLRPDLSYMIDSLMELREELGDQAALCMVVGSDAFVQLETWYRWDELLDYAHIVVLSRPGYGGPQSDVLKTLLKKVQVENKSELLAGTAGSVLMIELTQLLISATAIRNQIESGNSPRFLLPELVWQYIQDHRLYGIN